MRIGRVFGIDIRIDYSWFLIFLLVVISLGMGYFPAAFSPLASWILGILAALLLFASVLIHELAHSVTARRFGIEVQAITLFLFGGISQIRGEPRSARAEFLIAIVGPITSLTLAGLFWLFWFIGLRTDFPIAVVAISGYLWIINLLLAIFNMLPGLPLDGGRVLRSAIWQFTGDLRAATRWASGAGQLIGFGLMLWGVWGLFVRGQVVSGLWLVVIGWFLVNAAQAAYQQLQLRQALSGVAVADVMIPRLPAVDARTSVSDFVQEYLLRQDYPLYAVMEEERLRGLVAIEDVRQLDRQLWPVTPLGEIAHSPAKERTVRDDEDAWEALTRMMERDAPRLLVMRDGALEGVVSKEALVRLLRARMQLGFS